MPNPQSRVYVPVAASDFGEDSTSYVYDPYIPRGHYTVVLSASGTGKTFFLCGVAATLSRRDALPGDVRPNRPCSTLIISSEDDGEMLKKRLHDSNADLSKVFILDRSASCGLNYKNGYDLFRETVRSCHPDLVVIDPWQGFIGEDADINKANVLRPTFQRLSNLAKEANCGLVLVSHVSKKAQGENANFAAMGSTELVNAARSAITLIFDEQDSDARIAVHTKTNYSRYGKSIRFLLNNGRFQWAGYSDINRSTLEKAARARKTPSEVIEYATFRDNTKELLVRALSDVANPFADVKLTYDAFKIRYGNDVFGTYQPKRLLDEVVPEMRLKGYEVVTGMQIRDGKSKGNGFCIHPVTAAPEQIPVA